MFWGANLCRICAQIGETCIPIFEKDANPGVDVKIRRCLSTTVSKDDLKPKQVCQACFTKLNDFYNFVALFHESNYRFESLLYHSTQNTSGALPPQDCVDLGLSVGQQNHNIISSKVEPENLDCNLEMMLPLENLDVQERDFGEQNILNDIVQGAADVDIDLQNFVSNEYTNIVNNNTENLELHQSNEEVLNKLDPYLDLPQNVEFIKTESKLEKDEQNDVKSTSISLPNYSYPQNYFNETILLDNCDNIKQENGMNPKKSKLNILSVKTIPKPNQKDPKRDITSQKPKLNSYKKIINNSLGKLPENIDIEDLSEIVNRTANGNQMQNFVMLNENQMYGNSQNPVPNINNDLDHINEIDPLAPPYIDLENELINDVIGSDTNTDKNDNEQIKNSENNETKTKNTNVKRRNKHVNIISVKTICKAFEKQQPKCVVPVRPRTKSKKSGDNSGSKKRLPCNICQKSFARRQCLNEHMKKHGNIRPYVCDVCEKSFAIQWDLTFHKRVHTDLFSCQHCGKCFSAPSKLQRHVRIHTGERPFTCTVKDCGRSFSDKRNLIGHQLTHTNIRKFTCDICKGTYKTKSQLKDHMQAHSDNPVFQCPVCDKSYRWKTNLLTHVKKHNGSVTDFKKECGKLLNQCKKEGKKEGKKEVTS